MGFDTYFDVADRTLIDYRKQVGDLPRFVFDSSDVVIEGGSNAEPPQSVELVSSVGRALTVLEEQGFGWNACVAAYRAVRDGGVAESLLIGMYIGESLSANSKKKFKKLKREAEQRVEDEAEASAHEDLTALGQLLAASWLDDSVTKPLFLNQFQFGGMPEQSTGHLSQVIFAAQKAGLDPLPPARAIETLGSLFREARLVAWPILMTVFLTHLPHDAPVSYSLSGGMDEFDIVDKASAQIFVDKWWSGTGEAVADYARNLGVLFGVLADYEGRLGPQYWFGQGVAALDHLEALNADRSASTNKQRGDALERLVEALFNAEGPDLLVAEKNFRTEEEEIDLVLRSNLPDPFWLAQKSPYWFVECKNWSNPVGVEELRVFESKIHDRRSTVRVGVFVSTQGFYGTAVDRLKTAQTKDIGLIYAITLEDIRGLLDRRQSLSDWLLNEGAMRVFGKGLTPEKD
ncbi:restriction endonuclease [Microbacterium paraoxydans]|uniref:restriction endonuclease n=1 Tax=Microbacterium paraoxydans TaxID=199592 RepID=UPI0021A6A91E|nr:restriction endonuclease [Microbacterium paraoxydans]MCT2224092.1 restriction endonuclease [Microbacterium paraoxydans]